VPDAHVRRPRLSRSVRLLALLQTLRGRRGPVTAGALARELGVSERTIYRDISDLVAQGAPIWGEAGVGYVLRPGMFLPPLMLTEDETEAVLLGLRYVEQRGDDVLWTASESARAKIVAMLSPERQAAVDVPASLPGPNGAPFPHNVVPLAVMRAAVRERMRLAIEYADGQAQLTERVIWPIQIGFTSHVRVVAAWCELRRAFRFFRSDRIHSATPLGCYPARRADLVREFRRDLFASGHTIAPDRN
jgi:predicted DNA-binding transcriptional regulator YafY